MKEDNLKEQVITAVKWVTFVKITAQIISWGITIIVIRFLTPDDYGLKAIGEVIFALLVTISSLGFGASIIQNNNSTVLDLRKIFGLLIIVNTVLFAVQWFCAPLLARFYNEPRVTAIVQVLAVGFLLIPLTTIPSALLSKAMDFRRKSICDLISSISGGILTLALAVLGFGVWALVIGQLATRLFVAVSYSIVKPWLILPSFDFRGIKDIVTYGGMITVTSIAWSIYSRADIFIGGRYLSAEQVGFYAAAIYLAGMPMQKIMPQLHQIAFPAFAKVQNDLLALKQYFLKSLRLVSIIVFPMFYGLAVVADIFMETVLGSQWQQAIIPLVILCTVFPLRAINTLFPPVLNALGNASIPLKNTVIAIFIMIPGFIIGVQWGIMGLSLAWLIGFPLFFLVSVRRSIKPLGLDFNQILWELRAAGFATTVMVITVLLVETILRGGIEEITLLILLIIIGSVSYVASLYLAFRPVYCEIRSLMKTRY